jgi:hypothetical protein
MALSAIQRAVLRTCAEIAVSGKAGEKLDLFNVFIRDFHEVRDDIVLELSRTVQEISRGRRTVRKGDNALFANHVMGPCLYLVACNTADAKDVITDLTDDMVLYILGPYDDGFSLAKRASQDGVARYRSSVAEGDRRRRYEAEGKQRMNEARTACHESLTALAITCENATRRSDVEYFLRSGPEHTSWENIAAAAVVLGVSLADLLIREVS